MLESNWPSIHFQNGSPGVDRSCSLSGRSDQTSLFPRSHAHKLVLGDSRLFPSQLWATVPPACSRSALGPQPSGTSPLEANQLAPSPVSITTSADSCSTGSILKPPRTSEAPACHAERAWQAGRETAFWQVVLATLSFSSSPKVRVGM